MKKDRTSQGFTLIELLVVIAIIGVLSAVVLSSLNTARAKARDTRRLSDLKQIQTALELYYNDYGRYPTGFCDSAYNATYPAWSTPCWQIFLSPYMSTMPVDPINSIWVSGQLGSGYMYSYFPARIPNGCSTPTSTGSYSNYVITARLENYTASPSGCATTFSNNSDNAYVNYVVGQ